MDASGGEMSEFIIVGAGSGGCALAASLLGAPYSVVSRVHLLERGSISVSECHPKLSNVASWARTAMSHARTDYNYAFRSTPQVALGGRSLPLPRGRGLGGSSLLNATVYARPHTLDLESWPEGWQAHDVESSFRAVEDRMRINSINGTSLGEDMVAAALRCGHPSSDASFDRYSQQGAAAHFGSTSMAGRRITAAELIPMNDPRLNLLGNVLVHRVLLDEGRTAIGVELSSIGEIGSVDAPKTQLLLPLGSKGPRGEVILCAGAIESPALLLRSGVGGCAELQRAGIHCLAELPGVGHNLQDHVVVPVLRRSTYDLPESLCTAASIQGWVNSGNAQLMLLDGSVGPQVMPASIAASIVAPISWLLNQGLERRALCALESMGSRLISLLPTLEKQLRRIYGANACLVAPKSRGQVWIESDDPTAPPVEVVNRKSVYRGSAFLLHK